MPSHNILLIVDSLHDYRLVDATLAVRLMPDSGPCSSSPVIDRKKETDGYHMWIIPFEDIDFRHIFSAELGFVLRQEVPNGLSIR